MTTQILPDNNSDEPIVEITEAKPPTKEAQFTVYENVAFRDNPIKDSDDNKIGSNPRNTLMASAGDPNDSRKVRGIKRDSNHIHFFDNEEGKHFEADHPVGTRLAKSKYAGKNGDSTTDLLKEVKNFLQYTLNLKK